MRLLDPSPRFRRITAVLAAAALALAGPSTVGSRPARTAPSNQDRYTEAVLRTDLAAVQRSSDPVGLLAEVHTGERNVRARSGTAEVGRERPVPWNARFRAGSATKAFTAVVLLQLVAEHRLSLDDTVDHWLPGLVHGNGNDGREITVRQLLQHTGGIFDYLHDQQFAPILGSAAGFDAHRFDVFPPEDLLAIALKHQPTFTPPGSSWSYSNTDYLLVAMIIERVTGESWARQVQRRILTPLGLRHTSVATDRFIRGPHPHGYERFPDSAGPHDVTEQNITSGKADGAIISSTDDLNTFFRALLGGRLLPPAQLAEMKHTVAAIPPRGNRPGYDYGLGLMRTPLPCGGYYWHHDGDVPGFHTRTGTTEDGRRSVVLLLTTDTSTENDVDTLIGHALCDR